MSNKASITMPHTFEQRMKPSGSVVWTNTKHGGREGGKVVCVFLPDAVLPTVPCQLQKRAKQECIQVMSIQRGAAPPLTRRSQVERGK